MRARYFVSVRNATFRGATQRPPGGREVRPGALVRRGGAGSAGDDNLDAGDVLHADVVEGEVDGRHVGGDRVSLNTERGGDGRRACDGLGQRDLSVQAVAGTGPAAEGH